MLQRKLRSTFSNNRARIKHMYVGNETLLSEQPKSKFSNEIATLKTL